MWKLYFSLNNSTTHIRICMYSTLLYIVYYFLLTHAALVCGDPGTPRNGARRISSSGIGGIVYYTCDSGYYLSGDSERTCQQSGSNRAAWSGSLATCIAIECSDPGTPSNGGRNLGGRRVGDRVSYFCNSGYSLVGDSERTCQSSGLSSAVWSGSLPRCEGRYCIRMYIYCMYTYIHYVYCL